MMLHDLFCCLGVICFMFGYGWLWDFYTVLALLSLLLILSFVGAWDE